LQSMEAAIQKITLEKQELRCEKAQLEEELQETERTLASARDVVREWEGESHVNGLCYPLTRKKI
jgi:hypothetical protein